MVRLYAVVLLLSALGGPALSDGIWPDMTCNRPQVLDLLHDVLHRAGKPETIEAGQRGAGFNRGSRSGALHSPRA